MTFGYNSDKVVLENIIEVERECTIMAKGMSLGLRINPTNGETFDVWGYVTYKDFPDCGRIYYCAGSSYMEACVEKVYSVKQSAEELYRLATPVE